MQKDSDFELNPEVIYFSEDSIAENENEKIRKKLKNLKPKLQHLLIPEPMNTLLFFSVYL